MPISGKTTLAWLDHRIRSAANREQQVQRHGGSCLLDLERLLYLLYLRYLQSRYPDLAACGATDPQAWLVRSGP
ncbi:MAG: hypothetical protein QUV07_09895 [Cyanobium sp. CZS 25K]|nr:hypothetical protein [Cyanobium sp. CZS25K]